MSFLSAPSEVVNQLILQQLCSSLTLLHDGCFWVSHVPLCKCRCFWSVLSSPTSRLLGRATAQRAEERKGKLRTATANQSPKTTSGKSAGANPNQTSAVNQSKLLKQRVCVDLRLNFHPHISTFDWSELTCRMSDISDILFCCRIAGCYSEDKRVLSQQLINNGFHTILQLRYHKFASEPSAEVKIMQKKKLTDHLQ